ncbi:MAG: AI-2E family transporter [Proteobacteria bacterium]|nr:AI-2E family transporter [Pseudomonadota bacterium]
MQTKEKIFATALVLAIFCGFIYLVKSVLTPFIYSLIIAYFLDPLVDYLATKHKLSRITATSLILGLFLSIFISLSAVLLPIIYIQATDLVSALPRYLQIITQDFYPKIIGVLNGFGVSLDSDFSQLMNSEKSNSYFADLSQNFFSNALSSSATFINILSLIFITPILIFYLLKDWDILIKNTYEFLPKSIAPSAKEIAREIHKTLAGYVRGQFNVCFILAIFYSISLSLIGLNFGFLIGFLTGILAFIPYVGMLSGTIAALVVALFQWGFDFKELALVGTVFLVAQLVESNFLTPKMIGKKIGLHPVWMIFGLFFFGSLLGFIGVLIAVPLTAICSVVIKYFALKYKKKFVL